METDMKSILTATLFSLALATSAYAQSSDNSNDGTTGNPVVNGSGSSSEDGQDVMPVDPNATNSTQGDQPDPCSDANPVKPHTMTQDLNCEK
jgi:hypothetical protein